MFVLVHQGPIGLWFFVSHEYIKKNLVVMGLTSSEIVEEILHECHKLGIHKSVMSLAKTYIIKGKPVADSYEKAFSEVTRSSKTEKVNP